MENKENKIAPLERFIRAFADIDVTTLSDTELVDFYAFASNGKLDAMHELSKRHIDI